MVSWSTRTSRVTPGTESTESLELRREPPGNPESELKDELIGEAGGISERLLLAIGRAELALPGRLNSNPWTLASNERPDVPWG